MFKKRQFYNLGQSLTYFRSTSGAVISTGSKDLNRSVTVKIGNVDNRHSRFKQHVMRLHVAITVFNET